MNIKVLKDNRFMRDHIHMIFSSTIIGFGSDVFDKCNNEIYSGDIVKLYDKVYDTVIFSNGAFTTNKDKKPIAAYQKKDIEIVGYDYIKEGE